MKKSIVFIGIIFLMLLGTTVALAATEEFAVKATVENSRIYVGDKTKVGFTAIITDKEYSDLSIVLNSHNFADNGVIKFNSDCFTVSYSSSNSKILAVDDKGIVTGVSAGSATITQKIAFNLITFKAGPLAEEYYGNQLDGCKQSNWDLVTWQAKFTTLIARHGGSTYTRDITITVVPDDNLYLCQPRKVPAPVKMTMNAASAEIDRLCVGAAANVDFSITMTDMNDPAVKYTFNKAGYFWGAALDPENLTVSYSSDNESVATVDSAGRVTGVSEGWANIIVELKLKPDSIDQAVSSSYKTGKARLAVKPPNTARTVTFTRRVSILVHPAPVMNNLVLAQSESRQLTVAAPPGYDKALLRFEKGTLMISDPSIAKADPKTGIVTGLKPGSTSAVCYLKMSKESSIYIPIVSSVTVYPVMAIHPERVNVYIGTQETLQVTFDSRYPGNKTGTWSIANNTVASIDQSGKVTGIKAGTTTATFTITATGAQTDCTVVVAEPPFRIAPNPLGIYNGDTEKLAVTFDSGFTGDRSGTWSVADSSVVSLEENNTAPVTINRMHTIPGTIGVKVTGLKPGTTTMTYTNTATGAHRDCTVTVKPAFTIAPDPLTVYSGETGRLTVTFNDGYTGSRDGKWSVDDNTVVSIDQNGVVTGKQAGTAIVTYAVDATPATSVVRNGIVTDIGTTAKETSAYKTVRTVTVVVKAAAYTVSFDTQGGNPEPESVTVKPDTTVAKPEDPSLRDMKFLGWYTASNGGAKWNFAYDKVTTDMTLYAQWRLEVRSNTSSNDGSAYAVPTITGPVTINLLEGYGSIDQTYAFGGKPAPTYGISPSALNTAGATFSGITMTIPPGLDSGSYEVTIFATNTVGTTTKTIAVNVYPVIKINFVTEIEFNLLSLNNKIDADGGAGGPYTFTLASGVMPDGLTLNSDGTIGGTASLGLYDPVTVTVTDHLGNSITTTGLAVRVVSY